jgi:hypothetical protein
MKVGDKVLWLNAKEGSWTGKGKAEIVGYDGSRRFFGPAAKGTGREDPGPAVCIRLLDSTRPYDVWVSPDEIIDDLEALAAAAILPS